MLRMTEAEYANYISRNNDGRHAKEYKSKGVPKYRNRKVYVYGKYVTDRKMPNLGKPDTIFDSVAEYNRYQELQLLERAGEICNLERQVCINIQEKFNYFKESVRAISYVADFRYTDKDGRTVVEDVKAFDKKTGRPRTTSDFDLKWKLLKYNYPDVIFKICGR